MKIINYLYSDIHIVRVSREQLEILAIEAVCACWYYDLLDALEETTDNELVRIIERETCNFCEK